MNRTEAYQFTTESKNDPRITELKNGIKAINKLSRETTRQGFKHGRSEVGALYRVRLMPRGARVEAAWTDFRSRRAYDSYLPIRHGSRFDVYIHRDTSSEYELAREGETGLTPGQLKKLDKEQNELRLEESRMFGRLREAGIYAVRTVNGLEFQSREKRIEDLRDRGMSESTIERIV